MLSLVSDLLNIKAISQKFAKALNKANIWAIYLASNGKSYWTFNLTKNVPETYTLQDIANFSKGYLKDYPVFNQTTSDGLLILGYPKDNYTKIVGTYFSIHAVHMLPLVAILLLGFDFSLLFLLSA